MTANDSVSFKALDENQFRKFVVDELSARLAPIAGAEDTDKVRDRIMRKAYQKVWEMYNETAEDTNFGLQTDTTLEMQSIVSLPEIKITVLTEPLHYSENSNVSVTEKNTIDEQPTSKNEDTTPKKKRTVWRRFVNLFRRIVPSKRK